MEANQDFEFFNGKDKSRGSKTIGPSSAFHVNQHAWRYIEDLPIGAQFECGNFVFNSEEIVAFAEMYDPQHFHVSVESARETIFGGLISSSLHTLAACFGIFVRATSELKSVAGLRLRETEIPRPVRPGARIDVRAEWVAARRSRTRPNIGIVTVEGVALENGRDVVLRFGATFMVERRYHGE
ncbi:acyl dehydratase [Rhizobium sp. ARZ01]|uniref:MaoC/PaaZ C-terminal domain-containing protein n=1 Tax=Rhizobium sp. ARZ01 TaxID=2769313 RepID=UPI0017860617|nr:acyl dehydratase [Rhizobium sp. ARZ01]